MSHRHQSAFCACCTSCFSPCRAAALRHHWLGKQRVGVPVKIVCNIASVQESRVGGGSLVADRCWRIDGNSFLAWLRAVGNSEGMCRIWAGRAPHIVGTHYLPLRRMQPLLARHLLGRLQPRHDNDAASSGSLAHSVLKPSSRGRVQLQLPCWQCLHW